MRRHAGGVDAAVENAPFTRWQKTADDGKQRGLAGAVRSDQPGDAAGCHDERDSIDREQTAEPAGEALDAQQRLSHALATLLQPAP